MNLSSKLSLLTRFGFTLVNLYLIGYLLFNSNLMISALSFMVFIYLLGKATVMVMYIQWRTETQWKIEWTEDDERNYP